MTTDPLDDKQPTWQSLTDRDRSDLILCAITGELKAHNGNHRVLHLAETGLLAVKASDLYYTTYTLASGGRKVVISAPDGYRQGRFPKPTDVQQAKRAAETWQTPD